MKTILGIIMIIGAVVGGVFYIRPQVATVQALRSEVQTYSGALQKAEELRQERERLLNVYNSLDPAKLARLDAMIPRNIDNVKLAIEIENVASNLGLSLKGIDVKDPNAQGAASRASVSGAPVEQPYGTAEITFTVVGDYAQFVQFLERVEKSLRLIDIKSLAFIAPRGEVLQDTYEFQVSVSTYWVRDLEASAGL
jgi:Tfp pilus assembly protein PilO